MFLILQQLSLRFSFFFMTVISVMVASTLYDLYLRYKGLPKSPNIWLIFSVYTNAEILFQHSDQDITCLGGVKALSNVWIILGEVVVSGRFLTKNILDVIAQVKPKYMYQFRNLYYKILAQVRPCAHFRLVFVFWQRNPAYNQRISAHLQLLQNVKFGYFLFHAIF